MFNFCNTCKWYFLKSKQFSSRHVLLCMVIFIKICLMPCGSFSSSCEFNAVSDNVDLGTACGKYFRVCCLSIIDAGTLKRLMLLLFRDILLFLLIVAISCVFFQVILISLRVCLAITDSVAKQWHVSLDLYCFYFCNWVSIKSTVVLLARTIYLELACFLDSHFTCTRCLSESRRVLYFLCVFNFVFFAECLCSYIKSYGHCSSNDSMLCHIFNFLDA